MKIRIETIVNLDEKNEKVDVEIRRVGRVPRTYGGIIAGLHFQITEAVKEFMTKLGGKGVINGNKTAE